MVHDLIFMPDIDETEFSIVIHEKFTLRQFANSEGLFDFDLDPVT
jgi:hypothetical protein